MLDQQLLEILACPDTHHAPLVYDDPAQTLTCTQCHRVFPIRDGLPILLLDEARSPAPDGSPESPESPDTPVQAPAAGSGDAAV